MFIFHSFCLCLDTGWLLCVFSCVSSTLSFKFRSEFHRILNSVGNYFQSEQNHVPLFWFFLIFTRPEPLNLDWKCDTRICRSKSDFFRNHTNGIQDIQHGASLQISHFLCQHHCPGTTINNGIPIASDLAIPPSVYKGNQSLLLPSPTHESQREAGDGEFVWCFQFFTPTPNVFSWGFFN